MRGRKKNSLLGKRCGISALKKKKRDGTEADGQGDGPWVTSVTRMKVISLFFDAN